jgi:hypothetical protein
MDRIKKQFDRDTGYYSNEYRDRFPHERERKKGNMERRNDESVEGELRYRARFNDDRDERNPYEDRERNFNYSRRDNRSESRENRNDDRYERRNDRYENRNDDRYENRNDDRYENRNENRYDRSGEERESYAATLRNYHPRGGRRIEASKPEDTEWQSNSYQKRKSGSRVTDYDHEARNYNRQDDYRWNKEKPGNYSRYHRDDRGYRGDYDTDFFWQT